MTTVITTNIHVITGTTQAHIMTGIGTIPAPGLASAILDTCNRSIDRQGRTTHGRPCRQSVDADLQAQDNNRQLEQFFVTHEDRAFYVAYAALWDRESALDAVQESMLRLVEYYRDKPEQDWPALFRTILNSKINDIRRRRMIEQGKHKLVSLTGLFRQKDDNQASEEYELPDSARSDGITAPEVEFVAGEIRGKVADAMQTLPERQRQVFVLREWRGLSIKETAQTLGCSENSVKQHHFRAMRALRNQLAEVWTHAQPSTS